MANIDLGWEVKGQLTPEESVSAMIPVIVSKGIEDSGTFWTWENKVGGITTSKSRILILASNIRGSANGQACDTGPSKLRWYFPEYLQQLDERDHIMRVSRNAAPLHFARYHCRMVTDGKAVAFLI